MAKIEKIEVDLSVGPNPEPKAGDTVNYVAPFTQQITPGKVLSVTAGKGGRAVEIETGEGKAKKVVSVTYRAKEAIGGNTWHWPGKVVALALLALLLGLEVAQANLPTYRTFSAYGNATAPATIIMPADPRSQIRVVTAYFTSDTNIGYLNFSSGTTAYSLTSSNTALLSTTNFVNSTNGLAAGAGLILQHNGAGYTNAVSSWGSYVTGTNTFGGVTNQAFIVLTTAASLFTNGIAGDEIYLQGPVSSIYAGASTNAINGDDIFSGNFGRPVLLQLTPASSTNRLSSVSTHYDN